MELCYMFSSSILNAQTWELITIFPQIHSMIRPFNKVAYFVTAWLSADIEGAINTVQEISRQTITGTLNFHSYNSLSLSYSVSLNFPHFSSPRTQAGEDIVKQSLLDLSVVSRLILNVLVFKLKSLRWTLVSTFQEPTVPDSSLGQYHLIIFCLLFHYGSLLKL